MSSTAMPLLSQLTGFRAWSISAPWVNLLALFRANCHQCQSSTSLGGICNRPWIRNMFTGCFCDSSRWTAWLSLWY